MKHGADIYKYAKQLHCDPNEIIDFSSNINWYNDGYYPYVDIVKYHDHRYKELKQVIKDKYGVKKSQIALFNGASSAIYALLEQLEYKTLTLYAPLYGEYEKASKQKDIQKINRLKNLYELPKQNALVVFVNPSTPDGKYYDLKKLFKIWKKQNCSVILDESFLEFEEKQSYRDYIKDYPNLYIIQSFSKFYSCGGVRIGAVFSQKKNIKKLKLPLWNLSSFDVAFLQHRLGDEVFKKEARKLHKKRKKSLKKILQKYFKVFESDANFFLVQTQKKELFKHLLEDKILVRSCESFDFLDARYLRFAVKDKKAQKRLKQKLKSIGMNLI